VNVRRPVVAGNWKMHGSIAAIDRLLQHIEQSSVTGVDVLVFPPTVYLARVAARVSDAPIDVGAQTTHSEPAGAFTGVVSAEMVKDVGATHVLVGHSERRQLFGETDDRVGRKYEAVIRAGLMPILCVGETLGQRQDGHAESVVITQLEAALSGVGRDALERTMIAYEPVWAIGTGRSATPVDAQTMHRTIREWLRSMDPLLAERMRILYGGSINANNAASLFGEPDVDGGLVGGASLDAAQFLEICRAAGHAA
jgi:triosephosphate isomerase